MDVKIMFGTSNAKVKEKTRIDYNALPIPKGYVAGLGRGVTGFVTRSDIGPGTYSTGETEDDKNFSDNKFDEFMGSDAGMFAITGEYEDDDREADAIWDAVDEFVDQRRRNRRKDETTENSIQSNIRNPLITEQFSHLKRKLAELSYDSWQLIPEAGDCYAKGKNRYTNNLFKLQQEQNNEKKAITSSNLLSENGSADLAAVGLGRGTILSIKLDRAADSVTGQTVLDPKGYITELKSVKISTNAEASDIKKARLLLKSVVQTNPRHGPGWIAAARLEEVAGRLISARKIIMEGVKKCQLNEDVWLEAATLQSQTDAKILLAKGLTYLPNSTKLWIQAVHLEEDENSKSRLLRKALEWIPSSVKLWKAAIDLANEEDARILLYHAVKCCPQSIELWLALTKLETYEKARKVLNKARESIPTEPQIWFTASKLEEAQGNVHMATKIIDRGLKSLMAHGVVVERESWLKEAEISERQTPPMLSTCRAIVKAVIELGLDDQDIQMTLLADAEECLKRGSVETARSLYQHTLNIYPTKKDIWLKYVMLEKDHGTTDELEIQLRHALNNCPKATSLWLLAAKEKHLVRDYNRARQILAEAFRINDDSEEILISAFKIEYDANEIEKARRLLDKAKTCSCLSTPRIWMKSAILERRDDRLAAQKSILEEGIRKYPNYWKLWIMLAQLKEKEGDIDATRMVFISGLEYCPDAITLWINYAKLEEKLGNLNKSRALFGQGRLKNPKSEHIWLESIRFEIRTANRKTAEVQLAIAMQECPYSGLLWSLAINMTPKNTRKSKCTEAFKQCGNDPYIVCEAAKVFLDDSNVNKARNWLLRAVTLRPNVGDFWALLYNLEKKHGTKRQQVKVTQMCKIAEPKYGDLWCEVSKNPKISFLTVEKILLYISLKINIARAILD